MPDMKDEAPKPEPKNTLMVVYGGMLLVYFGVVVFGLYRSFAAQKTTMQVITDNAGSLAIFAACLALFAFSYAGRKK